MEMFLPIGIIHKKLINYYSKNIQFVLLVLTALTFIVRVFPSIIKNNPFFVV